MTAFHCDICGSASHDAIVCKPLPQSTHPRPLVMPCSRCGMSAVYNPRPGEDLVVCGDCGYDMGRAASFAVLLHEVWLAVHVRRFDGAYNGVEVPAGAERAVPDSIYHGTIRAEQQILNVAEHYGVDAVTVRNGVDA